MIESLVGAFFIVVIVSVQYRRERFAAVHQHCINSMHLLEHSEFDFSLAATTGGT